jgi:tetratricopeptide (TPR) repeat protein
MLSISATASTVSPVLSDNATPAAQSTVDAAPPSLRTAAGRAAVAGAAATETVGKVGEAKSQTSPVQARSFASLEKLDCSRTILDILPLYAHDVRQPLREKRRAKHFVRDLLFIGIALQLDENEIAAAQVFSTAHFLEPDNIVVTAYLADSFSRSGRMEEATKLFAELTAKAKDDPTITRMRALNEIRKTNYLGAKNLIRALPKTGRFKGDDRLAVIEARSSLRMGLNKTTSDGFRQAAKLTSSEYCRLLWLGVAAAIEDKDAERIDYVTKAGAILPADPLWRNDLAAALSKKNNDGAFDQQEKAVKSLRMFSRSFYTFANMLLAESKTDQAVSCLEYVLLRRPRSAEAHFALARLERARKNKEKTLSLYSEGLALNPFAGYPRLELASYYTELGMDAQALEQVRQATTYCPNYLSTWRTLGDYMLKQKKFDESTKAYAHALTVIPQPLADLNVFSKHEVAQTHAGLGTIYYTKGDRANALTQSEAFNQLKFVPKLENMASWLHLRPDRMEAKDLEVKDSKDSLKKEKELQEHVLLADMLLETKYYDDACKEYDKAIALNPDDSDLHSYLLNIYAESGKWSDALREDLSLSQSLVKKRAEDIGGAFKKDTGSK